VFVSLDVIVPCFVLRCYLLLLLTLHVVVVISYVILIVYFIVCCCVVSVAFRLMAVCSRLLRSLIVAVLILLRRCWLPLV